MGGKYTTQQTLHKLVYYWKSRQQSGWFAVIKKFLQVDSPDSRKTKGRSVLRPLRKMVENGEKTTREELSLPVKLVQTQKMQLNKSVCSGDNRFISLLRNHKFISLSKTRIQ